MKYFGRNLAYLRQEKGITQKELAKKINISSTLVDEYEVGKTNPDFVTVVLLAQMFEVGLEELVMQDLTDGKKPGVIKVLDKKESEFCTASYVSEVLDVSASMAYKILRSLREDLVAEGKTKLLPHGKVPKWYFRERCGLERV